MGSPPPAPGTKRARTRRALLEAAREVLHEVGYERTTLQAVAERAGMTTGAIYGNFKNRNALFVALAEAYWVPIQPDVAAGASLLEVMRALAAASLATLPERTAVASGRLEGMAHTLGDAELQARVVEATEESLDVGARWLEEVVPEGALPMPADTFIRVVYALSEGLILQRILTPALVPDAVFYAAFEALARPGRTASTAEPRQQRAPLESC
jgi:AcrR family transcriptional regulator